MVTVTIVSHGHGEMVAGLIKDLFRCPQVTQILLTQNIPETSREKFPGKVKVWTNPTPRGYGANHNAAFQSCRTPFFCVMNPDIRIPRNPFPALTRAMKDPGVAVCAPKIVSPAGLEEDSHRQFPDIVSLLGKAFGGGDGKVPLGQGRSWERNSWLGGMFLFLWSEAFRKVGGFDEKFFLYYEDVDLCARLIRQGGRVKKVASVSVVHDARRQSRRSITFASWHGCSLARYLGKRWAGSYRPLSKKGAATKSRR